MYKTIANDQEKTEFERVKRTKKRKERYKECAEMMFQQRQSGAKTQLLREDNEIETTGKARETTSLCATRGKGEGSCENGCLLGTMYMGNTWGEEESRHASPGRVSGN